MGLVLVLAGCGARDSAAVSPTGDSMGASGEISTETAESIGGSGGSAANEADAEKSELEASGSEEFDFEEWQRQREAEIFSRYDMLTDEDYAAAIPWGELTWGGDVPEEQLVLLGDLPKAETRIYGVLKDGCLLILEHQGQRRAFCKAFLTPRMVPPEFDVYDYDGDGLDEIGMVCYVMSGTGVAIRDFSVFDSVEDAFDTLHTMPWEEVQRACAQVSWSYEENVLRIGIGDEYEEHSLADTPFSGMAIRDLALGDITKFSFGESGEVFGDVELALALEEQVTPFFLEEMGTLYDNGISWSVNQVHFRVHYDGEGVFWTDEISLR